MTGSVIFVGDVFAQEVIIQTSADAHGSRFFGEGILQVIATDPEADNNDTVEEMQMQITAKPDSGSADTISIIVPETTDSSGEFEFFLVHVNSIAVGPGDLDPINSAGVEGDGSCVADCAPFITFGPGGDLDIQSGLYEEVEFEISEGNVEIKAIYEESTGKLSLDRDSYGTTSYVYISIIDQDANLNPSQRDEFIVDPSSDPNADLLVLDGGTFEDVITFVEKGDNTAVFEGRYKIGESISVSSELVVLTLFDKANYNASLAAPENDSNNVDETSFIVGNGDGTIDIGGSGQSAMLSWDPIIEADKESYSLGESVLVTVRDQDANANSGTADLIRLQISSGANEIAIDAIETGANTGVFEGSFHLAEETDETAEAIAPAGSATISYVDLRPADYSEKIQAGLPPEKAFAFVIDIQLPIKTGINSTNVTDPLATNAAGQIGLFTVDNSMTLSTSVTNNNETPRPFLAIIEVRDSSSGLTVFLALQDGVLEPSGSSDIEVLWQPDKAGTFQIRTFLISDLEEVEVLSPIAVSEITVN